MNASKTPVQRCPICRARQPIEATRCSNCGAVLNGIPDSAAAKAGAVGRTRISSRAPLEAPTAHDWAEDETDLYEGALPRAPFQGVLVVVCALGVLASIAYFVVTQVAGTALRPTATPTVSGAVLAPSDVPAIAAGLDNTPPPTNTKMPTVGVFPTLALATVTPAPPTATITPTRGPCTQKARQGDSVYALAVRCGHRDMSIVGVILDLNNMKDANQLQVGQTLVIPWPTPTGGAPAQGTSGGQSGSGNSGGAGGTPGAAAPIEPTLPAGVTWYRVKKNDTAVSIVFAFHTNMKTLQDLNPEIQFLQCDFGLPGGGPACQLRPLLAEGQRVRVPAPTPTPTLSPTLSGSETATSTPTPTFNAPNSQSPSDNMLFEASELPTMRWVASGQLGPNDVYLVTVRDTTTGISHSAATRDLSFQLPPDWQPSDGKRHSFEWSISVATKNDAGTAVPSQFSTEVRTFTWQSR